MVRKNMQIILNTGIVPFLAGVIRA